MAQVSLTLIPKFNSVVIRQEGVHYFIAAKDSIIIDEMGMIKLIIELGKIGFLKEDVLQGIADHVKEYLEMERKYENTKNSSNTGIG